MTHRQFRDLFKEFSAPSWAAWNSIEDCIFGVEPDDAALVRRITGRTVLPSAPVSELWAVKGRGGGGSRFVARLACYCAAGRQHQVAPGERIYIGVFAPDKKQAGITFGYIRGLLRSVPALASLIENERADSIDLSNGKTIEVIAANQSAPRGRAYCICIIEEAAFLQTDDNSAEPDKELIRALRPALARVPESLLVVISSPYAMAGELYRMWSERFGKDDADALVLQADTATLNPSFSAREIARAYRDDPVAASAEYGAQFRADVSSLMLAEAIAAVVPSGVREVSPNAEVYSVAHLDFAIGSGADAVGFAVAGHDETVAVLQALRHFPPPFDPSAVIAEVSALARRYGVNTVTIDRFAPGLVADLLRRHGLDARIADGDPSMAFVGLLSLVNSRGCRLLDNEVLLRELKGLERRTRSGGKDAVGHGVRGHDDLAAAAAFALSAASHEGERVPWRLINTDDAGTDLVDVARVASDPMMKIIAEKIAAARVRIGELVEKVRNFKPGAAAPPKPETAEEHAIRVQLEHENESLRWELQQQREAAERAESRKEFEDMVRRQPGGIWFPPSQNYDLDEVTMRGPNVDRFTRDGSGSYDAMGLRIGPNDRDYDALWRPENQPGVPRPTSQATTPQAPRYHGPDYQDPSTWRE